MKIRLAIWFLLLSGVIALGMGNNGVPPFFNTSNFINTSSVVDTFTAATGTTITRSSLNFGSNVTGRVIIVSIAFGSSGADKVNSVTIGGSTGIVAQNGNTGATCCGAAIYYATPSGTSGQSVVITMNSAVTEFSSTVYRLIASSTVPIGGNNTADTANSSVTVTAINGGSLFVTARIQNTAGAFVYSGSNTFITDTTLSNGSNVTANGSVLPTQSNSALTIKYNPTPNTTSASSATAWWH